MQVQYVKESADPFFLKIYPSFVACNAKAALTVTGRHMFQSLPFADFVFLTHYAVHVTYNGTRVRQLVLPCGIQMGTFSQMFIPYAFAILFFFLNHLCNLGHFLLCMAQTPAWLARANFGLGHTISNTNYLGFTGSGSTTYLTYIVTICYNNIL